MILEVKVRADWPDTDFIEATRWVAERINQGARRGVIQDVEGRAVGRFALTDDTIANDASLLDEIFWGGSR